MGLFTYTTPGATSRRTNRYSGPSFTPGSGLGQFKPRGFPERVDVSDPLMEGVAIAARGPAEIYEAPLSLINTIFPVTEPVFQGIRDLPVVGEHLSNLGTESEKAFQNSFNVVPALPNALDARGLEIISGLPDDAPLPTGVAFPERLMGALNTPDDLKQTVGDYRRYLAKLGWTPEDQADILAGRKGWFDFGHKQMNENALLDFGGRMILDPLNIVLGVGLISKAAKGTATYLRILNDGHKAAPAIMRAAPTGSRASRAAQGAYRATALPIAEGVAAIVNGTYQGITKRSLSAFVQGWVRGSGPAFRGWRNTGLATKGVQVGVNAIDELVPDDVANSIPLLESTFQFFRDMGENKPLSNSGLFQLWSIFNFPARGLLKTGYEKARSGKVRAARLDHEQRVLERLMPDLPNTAARKAAIIARWGEEDWNAYLWQLGRTAVGRKVFRMGLGENQALKTFRGSSLAEFGAHFKEMNDLMRRSMARMLDEGSLTGDDMIDALMTQYRDRGDVLGDLTGGLHRQVFDPEIAMRDWEGWSPLARKLTTTTEHGAVFVPGLSTELVTKEQIDWLLAKIELETIDGKINAKAANDILMDTPAIFGFDARRPENVPGSVLGRGTLERAMTRSAGELDAKEIRKVLREIQRDHATPQEEWMASAKAWEAREQRFDIRRREANRTIERDGSLARDANPDRGQARVVLQTSEFRRGTRLGAPVGYVSQVRMLRSRPNVAEAEHVIPLALGEAGFPIDAAVQVASIDGKVVSSGLAMKLNPSTDLQTAAEVAVLGAEKVGANKAHIVFDYDTLKRNGLPPNAMEFRWEFGSGRKTDAEWDTIVRTLRRDFGDMVDVNDTAGGVTVFVREGDDAIKADLEKRIERANAILGGEPETAPALVQDIVRKASKNDPPGTRTFESVSDIGQRSHKWHSAKSRLVAERPDLRPDAGTSTRPRVDGDGSPGAPGAEGRVGEGTVADRTAGPGPLTRWERANRGERPGEPAGQLGVGAGVTRDTGPIGEYQGRVRDSVTGNARGARIVIPDDAPRFITADRHSGAWVTRDGELLLWHKPRTKYGPDWGAVLADASDAATWTRLPDIRARRGLSSIDSLADHGWSVVAKDAEGVVYLVRDKSGTGRGVAIPTREFGAGGYASIRKNIPEMTPEAARAEAARHVRPPLEAPVTPEVAPTASVGQLAEEAAIPHRGALTYLHDADEEFAQWMPRFHPSVNRFYDELPEAERLKLNALETELKRYDPQYTIKLAPEGGTPFFMGQGDAYRQMVAGRRMASDNMFHKLTGPLARAQHALLDPVYSRDLHQAMRQSLYDQMVNHGASVRETNQFIRALAGAWELSGQVHRAKVWRRPDAMPADAIQKLFFGIEEVAGFKGFRPEVLKSISAAGDTPQDIVRRAGSRVYRDLEELFPAVDGKGNLRGLVEQVYGRSPGRSPTAFSAVRTGAWYTKAFYHGLRFILDPRWHFLNRWEADILTMARAGLGTTRQARAAAKSGELPSKATRIHGGGLAKKGDTSPNKDALGIQTILMEDAMASGTFENRRIAAYIGKTFDYERPEVTRKALREMIERGEPMYDDLLREFGGTPEGIVEGIEKMLYDWDTKGVRKTLIDEVAAAQIAKDRYGLFDEFLEGMFQKHQQTYKDIVHMFHGNVNRANLERLANAPTLWWPVSYQLKAGKWVIDLLTDRFAGAQTDLLPSWNLTRIMSYHNERLQEDDDYAKMWNEHPAMWRFTAMMIPMTPFDMGVFEARWTRYAQSWLGSSLGLWEKDPSYPQDLSNFLTRSIGIGPYFSADIVGDILNEVFP